MNGIWQDSAALLIVLAAAVYLLPRFWPFGTSRRATTCGGCKGRPSDSAAPPLHSIRPLTKDRR